MLCIRPNNHKLHIHLGGLYCVYSIRHLVSLDSCSVQGKTPQRNPTIIGEAQGEQQRDLRQDRRAIEIVCMDLKNKT